VISLRSVHGLADSHWRRRNRRAEVVYTTFSVLVEPPPVGEVYSWAAKNIKLSQF
jgi:hypothetical protein